MINLDVFIQVLSGCVSSLLIWWVINFIFSPRLKIEKEIDFNRFVEMSNKSLFNAYNVLIRVEYRNKNNPNNAHLGSKPRIPTIERGDIIQIELSDLDGFSVNDFFNKAGEKDSVVLLVSYESKFGVRKMAKRVIFIKKTHPKTKRV